VIDVSQLFAWDEDRWSNLIGSFIINFSCCEELIKIVSDEHTTVNKLPKAKNLGDHISNFHLSVSNNCLEFVLNNKSKVTMDRFKSIKSVRDTLAHNSLSIFTNENEQGKILTAELMLADKSGKVVLTLLELEQKVNEIKCIRRDIENLYKYSLQMSI
jgi:hypothetical protein